MSSIYLTCVRVRVRVRVRVCVCVWEACPSTLSSAGSCDRVFDMKTQSKGRAKCLCNDVALTQSLLNPKP
jgi:hypothetical protein